MFNQEFSLSSAAVTISFTPGQLYTNFTVAVEDTETGTVFVRYYLGGENLHLSAGVIAVPTNPNQAAHLTINNVLASGILLSANLSASTTTPSPQTIKMRVVAWPSNPFSNSPFGDKY